MAHRAMVNRLVWIVALVLVAGGCKTQDPAPPHATSSVRHPQSAPTTPTVPKTPKAALLSLGDLPSGFVTRPLTSRNLPGDLTGCPALERLMDGDARPQAQVEFFDPPLGPWIDEAIVRPAEPATMTRRIATALNGCGEVSVTEEGHTVRLAVASATAPQVGDEAHAYRATGQLHGIGLEMDVLLVRTGRSVLLLTNASLAGAVDPALTAKVTRTAVTKAGG